MKNQCTLHFEGIPLVLNPKGLVAERAWYLYKHIREHVSDDSKVITCPQAYHQYGVGSRPAL
jgi:hypothetical protein